jgi:hypothetical protein
MAKSFQVGMALGSGCGIVSMTGMRTFMTSSIKHHALGGSFRTILLLTGGVATAEDAMLEAIHAIDSGAMDSENVSEEALLREGVAAALRQVPARRPHGDPAPAALPDALVRVLRLPTHLRHCFVLRILAAFSRADCAQLLNLSIAKVDQRTCEAVWELGRDSMGLDAQPALAV